MRAMVLREQGTPLEPAYTGADGSFFFDFIENPHWDHQVQPSFKRIPRRRP